MIAPQLLTHFAPTLSRLNLLIKTLELNTDPSKQSKDPFNLKESDTDLFEKVVLRVGRITKSWNPEGSKKLFVNLVDIGQEQPLTILSGLKGHIAVEDMPGFVVVFQNLEARTMKFKTESYPSQGMILCAHDSNKSKVELLRPDERCVPGTRISVELMDIKQNNLTIPNIDKQPMMDFLGKLKTDENGVAMYENLRLSAGDKLYMRSQTLFNQQIS